MKNHYSILGVDPDASTDAIRAAYHREMRVHHPDRGALDGGSRAAELNDAYRCLSNHDRRRQYDNVYGFCAAPRFKFAPVSPHIHEQRRNRQTLRAEPAGPARAAARRTSLPLRWLVLLTLFLTLPFIYGIWTNGF